MTKISNQYSLTNILTADLANSRLGINNVSPAYSLDVTGTARVTGNMGIGGGTPSIFTGYSVASFGSLSTTSNGITIASTTTGNGLIEFADGITGNQAYRGYLQYAHTADSLSFGTAGSDRMIITSAGNVGIGTTFTPYGTVAIKSNSTTAYHGLNVFATGNGNFTYVNHDNNVGIIGTEFGTGGTGHTPLTFQTGGAERMRILTNGNVLIANTIYTADRLSVQGLANNWTGKFVASTTSGQSFGIDIVAGTTDGDYPLYVRTTNFSLRLYVRGDGVCYIGASSWVYNSDRRVKENISDVVNGLDLVSKLKPKHFDYINGAKNNLGFIAQEVQELIPQAVTISDEKTGMLGLKTDFIVPYLTKAIQELSAENTSLINRIEALENK
jgi:hypothetical protein